MTNRLIKIISTYTSTSGTSGIFEHGGNKYFFKKLSNENFKKEIKGYKLISKLYPVPNFVLKNADLGILIFDYEKSIGKNSGLLVDIFAKQKALPKSFFNILEMYEKVFKKTLSFAKPSGSEIFFEARIKNLTNVSNVFRKFDGRHVSFNNEDLILQPTKIKESVEKYFCSNPKKWCIVSQADPNDLNIGLKPIIMDYTAGGLIPLMAEFATYFWYNLAQGSYLALNYNPSSFHNHRMIWKSKEKVDMSKSGVVHKHSRLRIIAIKQYISHVIKPTLQKTKNYDWYEDFKNYLAMRILTVWDIDKMSRKDQLLVLSYLEYYYNKTKVKDPASLDII